MCHVARIDPQVRERSPRRRLGGNSLSGSAGAEIIRLFPERPQVSLRALARARALRRRMRFTAYLVFACMAAGSAALAGDASSFGHVDRDGNGTITLEELKVEVADRFAEADRDGNRRLSSDEILGGFAPAATDTAAGGLSFDEFLGLHVDGFAAVTVRTGGGLSRDAMRDW